MKNLKRYTNALIISIDEPTYYVHVRNALRFRKWESLFAGLWLFLAVASAFQGDWAAVGADLLIAVLTVQKVVLEYGKSRLVEAILERNDSIAIVVDRGTYLIDHNNTPIRCG